MPKKTVQSEITNEQTFKNIREYYLSINSNNIYILNVNNGEYYELSESASLIWEEIIKEKNSDSVKKKSGPFMKMPMELKMT